MGMLSGQQIGLITLGCIVAFLGAWLVTFLVCLVTERWQILDIPNERSSHCKPTPTLGGVGIIAGFWAGFACLWAAIDGAFFFDKTLAALIGVTLVCAIVAIDDLGRPLKVWEKLILQGIGVGFWLWGGIHLEWITLPFWGRIELGGWGWILTAVWLIGLCNIFNFMDGIDGISGCETIIICSFVIFFAWHLESELWLFSLILIAATAGFLVLNFPPARIFTGDVGSFFLGFMIAVQGIWGERMGIPLWIYAILMGYYLFDSSYTMMRRILHGENILVAHRKHLYQRLNALSLSHLQVDLVVLAISSLLGMAGYFWLFQNRFLGSILGLVSLGVMVAGTIAIERLDRCFRT